MEKLFIKLILGITFLYCLSFFSQTAGNLSFTFTAPKQSSGCFATNCRYVLAAWIESGTGVFSGAFVKTKLLYVGSGTDDHLQTWGAAAGCTKPNAVVAINNGCNITDATTGATSTNFGSQTFVWDGKNVNGASNGVTVADGSYQVVIQEAWGHGAATTTRRFAFTKGSVIDNQTPTADANFTGISLKWTPTGLGTSEVTNNKPQLMIAPNPSKGLISINIKNDANYITVFSLDGNIVYQESVKNSSSKNKELDLSYLQNGEYMVSVSNAYGSSYNKIIIAK